MFDTLFLQQKINETKSYYQKLNVRVPLQVAEQLQSENIRKL